MSGTDRKVLKILRRLVRHNANVLRLLAPVRPRFGDAGLRGPEGAWCQRYPDWETAPPDRAAKRGTTKEKHVMARKPATAKKAAKKGLTRKAAGTGRAAIATSPTTMRRKKRAT